MKTYIPFSNSSEYEAWDYFNCQRCKNKRCSARRALEARRNLTPHCVVIVGGTMSEQKNGRFCAMPARCASFTSVPASRRRDPGKNTPLLFQEDK